MNQILLLGAGLSSTSLIRYLLDNSDKYDWLISVGDIDLKTAKRKVNGHSRAKSFHFDVDNQNQLEEEVKKADVVISMLPARMHPLVAHMCLENSKHMITASYISDEIRNLASEVRKKNILFLNEIGVDPGIDHMSAMKVIHRIKEEGGKILSFKSSTGGLIAPEYDNNPWNYKFTWNPRNVVLAGNGVSRYRKHGRYKYIPYHKLFTRLETISILDYGEFEVYPNRDSLSYMETYDLQDIPTMFRGTMRRPGYGKAWSVFVELGLTNSDFKVDNSEAISYREFVNMFLAYDPVKPVEQKVCEYTGITMDSPEMEKLNYLGIFSDELIGLKDVTPAQILQHRLEQKWGLDPDDKDMIVMQHQFEYEIDGLRKKIISSLVVIGKNTEDTAMSITVGTPVAIATKLLLTGVIKKTGVIAPVEPDVYTPVLEELEEYGIKFIEETFDLD
jgi:saccharopine dehydrogenase-like NADP-dependent oxidoreductase